MRYSYVIWKEEIAPVIVVELLSEDTEKEDLGKTLREIRKPPTKWEVYEQILQIPYYVVFSREKPDKFQIFQLRKGRYHALTLLEKRCWIPEIKLGLGVWGGTYYNIKHQWLRWYDADGQWIPTLQERQEQAEKRADAETKRAKEETQARLAEKQRADAEAQARLTEKQRADTAEAELIRLKALLAQKGLAD
ncbi:Protein of unknown function DUF820 [Beggiatoa sp. PS]|nr:Protein of unknown function DUF820 [Beggiatoa sp. PS]